MAIFAMSLDLLVGFTGLVSFGHAAYFGIAAYAVALSPEYEAASLWYVLPASVGLAAARRLRHRAVRAAHQGHLFHHGDAGLRPDGLLHLPRHPLGGGSDGIYLNVKPSAAIFGWEPFDLDNAGALFYFILAMLVLVYLFWAACCSRPSAACWSASRATSTACSRSATSPSATSWAPSRWPAALGRAGGLPVRGAVRLRDAGAAVLAPVGQRAADGDPGRHGQPGGRDRRRLRLRRHDAGIFADWTKHWQLLMGGVIVAAVLFCRRAWRPSGPHQARPARGRSQ
jgi:branched-chain amino acid transport system permease protein